MLSTSKYASKDGFNVYVNYLALKKHFTTDSFDYHKYNGKIRSSFEKFAVRNDVYFFTKISKEDDYENLLLSNVLKNPNVWIREIADAEGQRIFMEWKKKIESLGYIFRSDLSHLNDDYKSNFISVNGQHPYIMTQYLQGSVSLETFTILTHIANIFSYWEKIMVDKIVAPDIIRLAKKYKPFLSYDANRFKTYVKDRFS